ncbi:MAG: hypothetical protein Q7T76_09410 [Ferruginibacter sp.]|nr:hypothetical protein [Ferruginibacter sp.]
MKKMYLLLLVFVIGSSCASAQETPPVAKKKFMQITTVESVVSGGLGRSKMLVTSGDGTQKEIDMENLFSLVGINFKNILQNENLVVKTLKTYTDDGWRIDQVTPFTLSPGSNGGVGIFMTRYFLSKSES